MSILQRPEEVIMAAIGALWVVLTYLCADYLGAPTHTTLLIAALTLIIILPAFLLWQRNRIKWIWPLFLGLLACAWWPFLDWLAVKDIIVPDNGNTLIIQRPWYADWWFKSLLALIPTFIGYALMWRQHKKRKTAALNQSI